MVCTGDCTIVLLVLFGGWSTQAFTHDCYLSFSADGLLRRFVLLVLFGGWSALAFTQLSYLSFSAVGLHRHLHMTATCPFRRMVCSGVYTWLLLVLFGGWSAKAICPTCPFRRMVCIGHYTLTCPFRRRMVCTGHLGKRLACPTRRMVCFIKCHQFMNNICSTVVSFRAWSSGLLHVLVFRVRRFDSRRIQSKRARMMRDGVPEADLPVGKAHMKRR